MDNQKPSEEEFNPWERTWDKTKRAFVAVEKVAETVVEAVKPPWLMDPSEFKKKGSKAPVTLPTASAVPVKTEAQMKLAAVIQPNERMPDTQSPSSNIAEIDAEIAVAKKRGLPKSEIEALMQERAKYAQKR